MGAPSGAQEAANGWGPPAGGLRCRVATVSASMNEEEVDLSQTVTQFDTPEEVALAVELQNVSDQPIRLLDTRYGDSFGESKGKSNADWFSQFLFSIDLLDDSGAVIERPRVELLDAHLAISGVLVVTLEPGQTRRFLVRPEKWLSVLAPRLGKGELRAVVHYHGVPPGVAERIREYRPESDVLDAWSGDAASSPAAFEIDAAPGQPVWGQPTRGVRAGVELTPAQPRYQHGEKVKLKLHVQNLGEAPITIATHLWLADLRVRVVDQQSAQHEAGGRFYTGWTLSGRVTLKPQQKVVLDAGNLGFAASQEQAAAFEHVTNRILTAPPGRYRVQLCDDLGRGFALRDGKGNQLGPLAGDWSGYLATGLAPLVVAED